MTLADALAAYCSGDRREASRLAARAGTQLGNELEKYLAGTELWSAYVPRDVTQYLRLFSDWGGTKLDRMRDAGYEVVVLDEGVEKSISGADVRAAMRAGEEWETLVPPGVARVIRSLDRVTA